MGGAIGWLRCDKPALMPLIEKMSTDAGLRLKQIGYGLIHSQL